jgi:hypothetical protein
VEWFGSGRDEWEIEYVHSTCASLMSPVINRAEIGSEIRAQEHGSGNLHGPFQLDIATEEDWVNLRNDLRYSLSLSENDGASFGGVVMCRSP